MTLSLLLGGDIVQIKLTNGLVFEEGEFIGTYMDHVHVLKGERLYYYACDDIRSITSALGKTFEYDCSENTVTADILFPPVLNPMTGEWAQKVPDVFNPNIAKPIIKKVADAIDKNTPTVDLGEVDPRFEEEVSTFEKKDVTEEDFIMINGVKYVKAAPDVENDENSIDVISERITDIPTTQWLELSQEYELLKKQRYMFPIAALMAFPISGGIAPSSDLEQEIAVPIIIASSVGYVYHQKKINNLQVKLRQSDSSNDKKTSSIFNKKSSIGLGIGTNKTFNILQYTYDLKLSKNFSIYGLLGFGNLYGLGFAWQQNYNENGLMAGWSRGNGSWNAFGSFSISYQWRLKESSTFLSLGISSFAYEKYYYYSGYYKRVRVFRPIISIDKRF